jgi:programmed cell death protein 5
MTENKVYTEDLRKRLADEKVKVEEHDFVQRQLDSAKKSIIQRVLSKDARQRLATVKVAHPALAEQIEMAIMDAAQAGAIKGEISEIQLRAILERATAEKKNFKLIK